MKFWKSAGCIFSAWLLVAGEVYAEESGQIALELTPESQKTAESDAREKPLREAEALIKVGKPAEAYRLLEPLEFERSGEVRFDYLIGIAALDSGKPDKATLAFERVLAADPNFAGARLDMARAYYQLGDLPRAKTEFETVAKQNPPEAARATIQKYLDAIAARQSAEQTRFSAYIEGMIGRDTNVNNSTSQSQINVPVFGNQTFTLSPTNLKTPDNYLGLAAGGEVSHDLSSHWGLYAGADIRQRNNQTETSFDTQSLDGRAGITFTDGEKNIFRIGTMGGRYNVARLHNRDSGGINADWRHIFSPANQASVFLQQSRNYFKDPLIMINNFTQTTLGAGWMHVLASGQSILFGSLFVVNEDDTAPITPGNPGGGRADGNKRASAIRAGGQTALGETSEFFAQVGYQVGNYDKTNAIFLRERVDRLVDATVGANWHWDKNWTVRPQLTYSKNYSNIVIYRYDRMDFSVTIRRDFK
ncbi:MAG TPA: tetratricopeptide repeat protein [Gallionella sp.]